MGNGLEKMDDSTFLVQGSTWDKELAIAHRTVKAHVHKMFLRFQISGGVKRVKLATL
jgi:hypothetical protein